MTGWQGGTVIPTGRPRPASRPGAAPWRAFFARHALDLLAALAIAVFFVGGVLTLPEYGPNWDEGLGNIFFGERYQYYFRTWDVKYLDFNSDIPYLVSLPLRVSASTWRDRPEVFPPLFDIVCSASMHLFSYKLQLLDPVDGFHLPVIVFAALFLVAFYLFLSRRAGKAVALAAVVFLAASPRFFGDAHFNQKDVPETLAFGLALMVYVRWTERRSWGRAVAAGLAFGLALSIKVNALFLPFVWILGVWSIDLRAIRTRKAWQAGGTFLLHHLVMTVAALHVFVLSWPYLWADPRRISRFLQVFLAQGGRGSSSAGFSLRPLLMMLAVSPEWFVVLLLPAVGFALSLLIRRRHPLARFLLAWMFVPLVRICLPGMVNFDGIRHFLEFLPAACAVCALGICSLMQALRWPSVRLKLAVWLALAVLFLFNSAAIVLRYHPFEHLFYNSFIGGRSNADLLFGSDELSDYWAVSYRKGMDWLRQNAVPGSALYVPVAGHLVRITAGIWLRTDIQVVDRDEFERIRSSGLVIYVMFITRPAFYDDIARICNENLQPELTIDLLGQPLLQIYRWQPGYSP